jgi:hypothetical protein
MMEAIESDVESDKRPEVQMLFKNIKEKLPELKELLAYDYEDFIYRFYHHSFKVYALQGVTIKIVKMFELLSNRPLNTWFKEIVAEGTGKEWKPEDNRVKNWLEITGKIVTAFFHARYFLEQMVKYAESIKEPPNLLPSGWASVLYLYNLR